ncbi:MAG: hypothetical protein GY869_24560, partial [Planctomycetes bacterium]|nr:hypothetical protein [Planctomycetota bacterium]
GSDQVEKYIRVLDSVGIGSEQMECECPEVKLMSFGELIFDYLHRPDNYADGIGRILRRAIKEPGTMQALKEFLG